jgi:hypothetical protein
LSDEAIAKPDELLVLHGVTAELFDTLRRWFDVPTHVTIDLTEIDSAVAELADPVLIAAMAMRKLQALHLLATPGVQTTTDVVIAIVQDLQRALLQAPTMRLRVAAQSVDWDAAFESLDDAGDAPSGADAVDPEIERFRGLHALVVSAAEAVYRVSDGEIRVLV